MRRLLAVLLMLGVAGVAGAVDNLGVVNIVPDKDTYVGDNMSDGREGGETAGDAVVIGSLPYNDSGATCDNTDDLTLTCAASNAPEVFYSYTPAVNGSINVSLCGSGYDCALGIYDSGLNEIACNDDFCGLQSQIDNILVSAGQTYYIVVDGFSTNCGSYVIAVTENVPCVIECPVGAQLEGEPPCGDNYFDSYNGGCNSSGYTILCPVADNSVVLCGKGGTYLYQGLSYRDTDWFIAYGNGETMTATWRSSFPMQAIFIYGTDCNNLVYDLGSGGACQDIVLSRFVASGTIVWLWAGASQFNGIPCESDYTISVTGLGTGEGCEPSPVETSSWGAIKNLYKN